MSFAIFAIGSNDVDATSTAASTAVLTISATRTNVIASKQDRQLELARAEPDRRDENGGREREVDPHVPLRADDVDDPFDREVEALEEGLAPLAGHPRTCSSSRVSISSPWS